MVFNEEIGSVYISTWCERDWLAAICEKQTNFRSLGASSRASLNLWHYFCLCHWICIKCFSNIYLFKEWKYQMSNCMIFWGVLCKASFYSLKSLETLGFFFSRVCCVMDVIGIFCFSDHLLCPLEMSPIHPVHKGNNSLYKHRMSQLQLPIHSGDIQE